MRYIKNKILLLTLFFIAGLGACKKWDEHISKVDPATNENLFQQIGKRTDLSLFTELLVKSGYDKVLANSKTYTVWAPDNGALQSLEPSISSDTAKLRLFITNHISNFLYYSNSMVPSTGVKVLNGKNVSFTGTSFADATVSKPDQSASNGVFHIINKAVLPLQNAWEFVNSAATQYKENVFIKSQVYKVLDLSHAVVDSISSSTGNPVYKPGTDSVTRNRYNDQVYDLNNEDKRYTYFILNDTAFSSQVDSLKKYFATGSTDSTASLAAWNLVKHAVVEGEYSLNQLPDTLVSKYGVKIPIDRNAIVETRKVSNGTIYVMKTLHLKAQDLLPVFVVQGEAPYAVYPGVDRRSVTFFRVRKNPVSGLVFTDIELTNLGINGYWVMYHLGDVPSGKYKVYWVAVNDLGTAFNQRLAMGSPTSATFAYTTLSATPNYSEVLLGEYTMSRYGDLNMFLTSAANTSATVTNSLVLDYIKLVPSN
jgi:uncharacterized surface protein with fasciclin (FAS1) repeats